MDAETIIIVAGFMWAAWVLLKIHKRRQETSKDPADAIVPQADNRAREMPRIGEPGSITFNQLQALRTNSFTPDRNWSREEAALILDAVKYLRVVCHDVGDSDDGPPPIEIQNDLLRFILTQQDLRDYIRKWARTGEIRDLTNFRTTSRCWYGTTSISE